MEGHLGYVCHSYYASCLWVVVVVTIVLVVAIASHPVALAVCQVLF